MERRGEKFRRLRQHWKPEKYYPPGYEYRREWNVAAVLLGAGIVYSFRFLAGIQKAAEALYELRYGVKVYLRGVRAVSFAQLMQGYWFSFAPLFLFLAGMVLYHYIYYYRGTKSIYLMRRLPQKTFIWRSCVEGSALWAAGTTFLAILWYVLFYGIYLLCIPAEYREAASLSALFGGILL